MAEKMGAEKVDQMVVQMVDQRADLLVVWTVEHLVALMDGRWVVWSVLSLAVPMADMWVDSTVALMDAKLADNLVD